MSKCWYVLHCKHHMETCVAKQLGFLEIELFYPTYRARVVNPRARKIRPLFPGYMFVYLELESTGSSIIKWIPGVIGLVEFDDKPAYVPDGMIAAIRHRVQKFVNTENRDIHFEPGEAVRVMEGPLAGLQGIFNLNLPGRQRARILLKILGEYYKRVELPVEYIYPIKQS